MLLNLRAYHRPKTLAEALALLRRPDIRTVPIGGGTQVLAEGAREVEAVVDLQDLGLNFIRLEGNTLRIGATTPLQAVVEALESAAYGGGILAVAARETAPLPLRNQRTVGGAVVGASGEQPLATVLIALEAELVVFTEPDSPRALRLEAFYDYREALRRQGMIATEIRLPLSAAPMGASFHKVARTPADAPIVGVAVRLFRGVDGACYGVRVAVGGVASRPVRLIEVEHLLEGRPPDPERFLAAARLAREQVNPPGDFRGSPEYRREMVEVLLRRALADAARQAGFTG
ncbi:Carbon monoxide dehydrogenase medium chain [Candidatus Thermoflexus japonica]|uniref:Carbon monoxide dehydrogenase medium chain n=1 Tax=Candidatus Thermoflexus japonica TaxID=2035417 RepID=A0A2H5Y9C7_9CHLR|nr:Carbon monoxide dehydrogenase medium chain [Candidatus Thermoflexus japonica]